MRLQAAFNAEQGKLAAVAKKQELVKGDEAEEAYLARVRVASQHTPPVYFGRPKVQWFH